MFTPHVRMVAASGKVQDFPHDSLRSARQTAHILNRQETNGIYRCAFVVRLNENGKTLRTLLEECKA